MNCCWKRGWHMDAVKSSGESPGITEHSFRSVQSFVQWTEVLFNRKVCRRPTQLCTNPNLRKQEDKSTNCDSAKSLTGNDLTTHPSGWVLLPVPFFLFSENKVETKHIFYSTYIFIYNTSEINTAKFSRKKVHFWCSARDLCPVTYFKPAPLWSLAA